MQKQSQNMFTSALILAAFGAVIMYVLGSVTSHLIFGMLNTMSSTLISLISTVITLVRNLIAMVVACALFSAVVTKTKLNAGAAILCSIITTVILFIGSFVLTLIGIPAGNIVLTLAKNFAAALVGALVYCAIAKPVDAAPQAPVYQNAQAGYQTAQTAGAASEDVIAVPDLDRLMEALLIAVRPNLAAPLTAVLCSKQELRIHPVQNEYVVEGYVSSQNRYGVMTANGFTATARYQNGIWFVTSVGVR